MSWLIWYILLNEQVLSNLSLDFELGNPQSLSWVSAGYITSLLLYPLITAGIYPPTPAS